MCQRREDMEKIVGVLKTCAGLDKADRVLALDAVKRAVCNCFETCDQWVAELIEEVPG